MTKKSAPVHYSPKQVEELKKIKRDNPRPGQRRQLLKDWAAANNRTFEAVRAFVGALKVRKTNGHRGTTVVQTVAPQTPVLANTGVREVRFPIQSWRIEKDELIITY